MYLKLTDTKKAGVRQWLSLLISLQHFQPSATPHIDVLCGGSLFS